MPNLSGKTYAWEYTRMSGNHSLIDTVQGPVHLVDNQWDTTRDVMLSKANTTSVNGSTVNVSTIGYTVNGIGQREGATRSGAATNSTTWKYDPLGQLIASDDSTDTSDRAYGYDSIGNRTKTASGTFTLPAGTTYQANALNQYTYIQESPAQQLYDADGNMTRGRLPQPTTGRNLLWDGENRLVEVKTLMGASVVKYAYDAQGRRVVKTTPTQTTRYLYDDWNCIAEYTGSTPVLDRTAVWGLDLSGTMQGAGGVGGLLSVKQGGALYYPTYDGNGNVTEYLNASKTVVAHFEYDPFGGTIVNTDATGQFPYRFSTKPVDVETGLHYYGFRWYNSLTGRWPSRDPIEEEGGVNLYGFVGNNGVNEWDRLGLFPDIFKESEMPKETEISKSCWVCVCWFTWKFKQNENKQTLLDRLKKEMPFEESWFYPRRRMTEMPPFQWMDDEIDPKRMEEARAQYLRAIEAMADFMLKFDQSNQQKLNNKVVAGYGKSQSESTATWKAEEQMKNRARNQWEKNGLVDWDEHFMISPEITCKCVEGLQDNPDPFTVGWYN